MTRSAINLRHIKQRGLPRVRIRPKFESSSRARSSRKKPGTSGLFVRMNKNPIDRCHGKTRQERYDTANIRVTRARVEHAWPERGAHVVLRPVTAKSISTWRERFPGYPDYRANIVSRSVTVLSTCWPRSLTLFRITSQAANCQRFPKEASLFSSLFGGKQSDLTCVAFYTWQTMRNLFLIFSALFLHISRFTTFKCNYFTKD